MRISLIWAMARNRVIGQDNGLPWRLPEDLRRFKRLTLGHTMLMGRKTFQSIGRTLPGRTLIVVTRQENYAPEGVQVVHSVEEGLDRARASHEDELFVAGGSEIYRQTLPAAGRLHLTLIEVDFPGDVYFPEYDESQWELVDREDHGPSPGVPFSYSFQVFDRRT